jgi:hypothetical protein
MMVLAYRIAPPENRVSLLVVRMLGLASEVARVLQWIALWGFIWTHLAELGRLLGAWEKTAWVIALAGWVWTEIEDFMVSHAMAKKNWSGEAKKYLKGSPMRRRWPI